MGVVIGITRDGVRHTDPKEITIKQEDYARFYDLVMNYEPNRKKGNTDEETA